MVTRPSLLRALPVVAQVLLGLGSMAALSLFPPASGPIALVALDGRDAGRLVGDAVDHGGTPIGRGPLSNILLVEARRDQVALPLLKRGVLAIAAPRSWCGAAKADA